VLYPLKFGVLVAVSVFAQWFFDRHGTLFEQTKALLESRHLFHKFIRDFAMDLVKL
jgi:hypothetical protein